MKKQLLTLLLLAFTMMASAESVTLTFDSNTDLKFHWVDGDEGDPSYWYFGCKDKTGHYLLRLAYNTEKQTGKVNFSDILTDYSWLEYENAEEEVFYNKINFTDGSVEISTDDVNVYVKGNLTGDDGNTYKVDANCPKPQPKTVNIEGTTLKMAEFDTYSDQWDVHFVSDNTDWGVKISVKGKENKFVGTYTQDDIPEYDGCYAENLEEDENHPFTKMEVTFALPEGNTDPSEGCEITGWGEEEDGTIYKFHMLKHAPIKPKEVKNIKVEVKESVWPTEATDPYYEKGAYYEVTEKNNPDNHWYLTTYKTDGTATSKKFEGIDVDNTYCKDEKSGYTKLLDNGTITQTLDAENLEMNVEAALVMDDSVQYNFSFKAPVTKKDEKTLKFTDLQVDESYKEYGTTILNASNDSTLLYFQLLNYSEIPAEYTAEDVSPELFILHKGDTEFTDVTSDALVYAKSELKKGETVPTFKAKFLGTDGVVYTVEASYVQPEATEKLDLDFAGCSFGDYTKDEDDKCFYFTYSEDSAPNIAYVKVMSDKVEGHYTMDDLNNNSRVELLNEAGIRRPYYIWDADIDVTKVDTVYTLAGTVKAGPYAINLKMKYKMEGLDNDDFSQDIDVTYAEEDMVEITPDDETSSMYVKLVNEERNDELCLVLYPEEYESGMTEIPAATYNFADDDWAPYAKAGMPNGKKFDGSYYAQLTKKGKVQTPLWFLREGNVVVDEDGAFEVRATNSFGRTVRCVYKRATGINAIKTVGSDVKDGKILRNGEIVIRKNGVEYNALGQRR